MYFDGNVLTLWSTELVVGEIYGPSLLNGHCTHINIARVQKCPDVTTLNSLFGLCRFVFSSFASLLLWQNLCLPIKIIVHALYSMHVWNIVFLQLCVFSLHRLPQSQTHICSRKSSIKSCKIVKLLHWSSSSSANLIDAPEKWEQKEKRNPPHLSYWTKYNFCQVVQCMKMHEK